MEKVVKVQAWVVRIQVILFEGITMAVKIQVVDWKVCLLVVKTKMYC